MKVCFKCNEEKPLSEFYKHKKMADGHLNKCILCTKNDVSKYREENLEKIRLYDNYRSMLPHRVKARKEYAQTEEGKRVETKSKINYREKYPYKRDAVIAANNAKRCGRIKVEICEKCGSTNRLEMHHDDYSKPLDVRILCQICHKRHHAEEKRKRSN